MNVWLIASGCGGSPPPGSGCSGRWSLGSSVLATGLVSVPPLHFAANLQARPITARTQRTVSLPAPCSFRRRKYCSTSKALSMATRLGPMVSRT